jgi:hypothetical protein
LVAGGEDISHEEWVRRLQEKMDDRLEYIMLIGRIQLELQQDDWLLPTEVTAKELRLKVIASGDEIDKAHQLLGRMEDCQQELRSFLLEKFRFEDVL